MPATFELILKFLAFCVVVLPGVYVWWRIDQDKRKQHKKRQKRIILAWDALVARLQKKNSDTSLHHQLVGFLNKHPNYSEVAYRLSLDLVAETEANPSNKVLALNIGRMHYSMHRKDRVPTVYDEAAIENDIKARC